MSENNPNSAISDGLTPDVVKTLLENQAKESKDSEVSGSDQSDS